MLAYVLVVITTVPGAGIGTMVNTTHMPSKSSCETVLLVTAQGLVSAFTGNAVAVHQPAHIERDEGWSVVLTGMNRELARLTCVGAKN